MKVSELISELQQLNPDADVTITDPMRNTPIYEIWAVFEAIAGNVVIAYNWETDDLTLKLTEEVKTLYHLQYTAGGYNE